jgi:hypothetical protein
MAVADRRVDESFIVEELGRWCREEGKAGG